MTIGTVRPEEARVFDSDAGYHEINGGSVEVFFVEPIFQEIENIPERVPGWYWWPCRPGCLPDSDPVGPFASSSAALADAEDS